MTGPLCSAGSPSSCRDRFDQNPLLNDANKTTLDILYVVPPGILRGKQNLPSTSTGDDVVSA